MLLLWDAAHSYRAGGVGMDWIFDLRIFFASAKSLVSSLGLLPLVIFTV